MRSSTALFPFPFACAFAGWLYDDGGGWSGAILSAVGGLVVACVELGLDWPVAGVGVWPGEGEGVTEVRVVLDGVRP